eukprot:CAMPEP_0184497008 /NCGR_PEP_ID=MMETSP0113_2-20130426/35486_1 /TAXON_ID=91329 /ORGANISM="Norrisiella sphaerica, Strain BC52" /LENGTH=608 /DNA_ID=CAMNT_0026883931 /DNA_START=8 /DNA_END=1835 /DNA_ORIENTATION=-
MTVPGVDVSPSCSDGTRSGSAAAAIQQSGWPKECFEANSPQRPVLVDTEQEFVDKMLFGDHMDSVVVLKGGIQKMKLDNALPCGVLGGGETVRDVRSWLSKLPPQLKAKTDARIYYFRQEDEVLVERELKRHPDTDKILTSLEDKEIALNIRQDIKSPYLAEFRYKDRYVHPLDYNQEKVKTLSSVDVKDYLKNRARILPYIDRIDEGVFVGGALTGSCVHVDQVLWSNVGKNFAGYKVFAVWKFGRDSNAILEHHHEKLFLSPLTQPEKKAILGASTVALLEPGDVFFFSGANAHTAVCVGDQISVTSYESFVNLSANHLRIFCGTNDTSDHFEDCHMHADELSSMKEEVCDSILDMLELLQALPGAVSPRATTMAGEAKKSLLPEKLRKLQKIAVEVIDDRVRDHILSAERILREDRELRRYLDGIDSSSSSVPSRDSSLPARRHRIRVGSRSSSREPSRAKVAFHLHGDEASAQCQGRLRRLQGQLQVRAGAEVETQEEEGEVEEGTGLNQGNRGEIDDGAKGAPGADPVTGENPVTCADLMTGGELAREGGKRWRDAREWDARALDRKKRDQAKGGPMTRTRCNNAVVVGEGEQKKRGKREIFC